MLPQRDVIAGWQVFATFDPIVEPTSPFESLENYGAPRSCEAKAPVKGQKRANQRKDDSIGERPEKKERSENERAKELHAPFRVLSPASVRDRRCRQTMHATAPAGPGGCRAPSDFHP